MVDFQKKIHRLPEREPLHVEIKINVLSGYDLIQQLYSKGYVTKSEKDTNKIIRINNGK